MSNIERHFKKIEKQKERSTIPGVDCIYLINLDERPEKLANSLEQLKPFGITPQRFPAIYGWGLTQEAFNEIGMKFLPPMDFAFDGQVFFRPASDQLDKGEPLKTSSYGKTCVHRSVSAGALGGALSHLSCLQDAYDQ
ncbi:MAG TPA: hypothetical protein DCE71_08105, partial [Parachlamydiales bacterium]|nr:hypothetical protein [Parachlamydiales bacterium]